MSPNQSRTSEGMTLGYGGNDRAIELANMEEKLRTTANRVDSLEIENEELKKAKRRIRLLEQENEVLRRAAAYLSQANLPPK